MRYKILYVDDETSNLRIFKDSFRRDFDILTAESGPKALDILKENKVDVVITDQKMPDMTGVELLKAINTLFNDIPPNRLILSGYTEDEEIKKAFKEYKLSKFISKPWDYNDLKQTITDCINN
ncbi:response regulator [Plebeiibacterium marinum]|uniref:Response regulator n=1 Tax=Plebeiibacterium marinum TaxID=2992111 RepID=A0AAE3MHV7_9BACT|nr:response regulator [Plebeiobacterium marinum]MCW3808009.1 response regulator [Plebeiobacterium marinum]